MKIKDLIFTKIDFTSGNISKTTYKGVAITVLTKPNIYETVVHTDPPKFCNCDIRDFPEMSVDLWLACANNIGKIKEQYGIL
jgi:hypothetical protein